jgi:ABC-type molybdenum transport system ATPase subunit/photorepair protein PhrA
LRCNGSGKTTFIDCNNCDNGKSSPKVQVLGVCVLCEGKGRVEIPAS